MFRHNALCKYKYYETCLQCSHGSKYCAFSIDVTVKKIIYSSLVVLILLGSLQNCKIK